MECILNLLNPRIPNRVANAAAKSSLLELARAMAIELPFKTFILIRLMMALLRKRSINGFLRKEPSQI